ncbi:hypothetical protein FBQ97_09000 [Acidobacteria bacterium ACD]|nr:hypothetical protein [Acidobacteria bacterium ACD]
MPRGVPVDLQGEEIVFEFPDLPEKPRKAFPRSHPRVAEALRGKKLGTVDPEDAPFVPLQGMLLPLYVDFDESDAPGK